MSEQPTIRYTYTDEAPALATHSLLPVVRAFAAQAGISVELRDISLAGRIIAAFPERLTAEQRIPDHLAQLGAMTLTPEANIIKLPNISASLPQLKAAIAELQAKGYDLPDHPDAPSNDDEREIRARYDRVKGSAVNPVLREGNSDRRAPRAVKEYARSHPHSMGAWEPSSTTHVATMGERDFRSNEQSTTVTADTTLRIEHVAEDGSVSVLKDAVPVLAGEVIDATFMDAEALRSFLDREIAEARSSGILLSLHMKATMMKVSDPIIFGHAVRAYFAKVFAEFGDELAAVGANPNNGLAAVLTAAETLPPSRHEAFLAAISATYESGPDLSMVDSDRGITNLHVPSDVIVDASMPAMIRNGGRLWDASGATRDTKAIIPDSCYAGVYQAVIDDCRVNGALDPATIGTVPNVGLMAQKAEEYGSHDKTFEIDAPGTVRVVDADGGVLLEHMVSAGDVWRMCQVKDLPIRDWVRLAVSRARATGAPAVFWLDESRAHDRELIAKVREYLGDHDTAGLTIEIMAPIEATRHALARMRRGEDTISVTGNVLRDYLTDLFPILELGTSAKMLSIVPLMNGGGLFETGAGGSAPKHVQQFQAENYLRWDSLGEFLALAVSFEHLAEVTGNSGAAVLATTLDLATGRVLDEDRSPARRVGGLDNRGSHFYLALYWAQALASQTTDAALAGRFAEVAARLADEEQRIVEELAAVQGSPVDVGGYYSPDQALVDAAMRPSATFNAALALLG
ncbi:MAG: NADP-dependent isocitrate dehydrogenase [Ilumatobacteraceae bacterium]